jgi:hypothetical protein
VVDVKVLRAVAAAAVVEAHCRQICEEESRIDGMVEDAISSGCDFVDPGQWAMDAGIDAFRDVNDDFSRQMFKPRSDDYIS